MNDPLEISDSSDDEQYERVQLFKAPFRCSETSSRRPAKDVFEDVTNELEDSDVEDIENGRQLSLGKGGPYGQVVEYKEVCIPRKRSSKPTVNYDFKIEMYSFENHGKPFICN